MQANNTTTGMQQAHERLSPGSNNSIGWFCSPSRTDLGQSTTASTIRHTNELDEDEDEDIDDEKGELDELNTGIMSFHHHHHNHDHHHDHRTEQMIQSRFRRVIDCSYRVGEEDEDVDDDQDEVAEMENDRGSASTSRQDHRTSPSDLVSAFQSHLESVVAKVSREQFNNNHHEDEQQQLMPLDLKILPTAFWSSPKTTTDVNHDNIDDSGSELDIDDFSHEPGSMSHLTRLQAHQDLHHAIDSNQQTEQSAYDYRYQKNVPLSLNLVQTKSSVVPTRLQIKEQPNKMVPAMNNKQNRANPNNSAATIAVGKANTSNGSAPASQTSVGVSGGGGGGAKQRRLYKCRHCPFKTDKKIENWQHIRIHMRPEKLLSCESCQFVTEYKHHLEYHQRNHSGYKPFRCDHCDYQCVNKSMLNSHMKSHSSVYQYQCGDCKYATKYVHSLKMHLRKYNHQPAQLMIDIYGRKRGPKSSTSSSSTNSVSNGKQNNSNNHEDDIDSNNNNISGVNKSSDANNVVNTPSNADQGDRQSNQSSHHHSTIAKRTRQNIHQVREEPTSTQFQQCILDLRVDSKIVH